MRGSYPKLITPEERVQTVGRFGRDALAGRKSKQEGAHDLCYEAGAWTQEDSMLATAEGWDVFEVDMSGRAQIQRDDEAMRFACDDDAIAYVVSRMNRGGALHTKAWVLHVRGQLA